MNRDLRKYARQTNVQLIAGALVLLFIIGDGLIYFIYGAGPALFGLLCLVGAFVPVLLTLFVLFLLGWIGRHADRG